MTESLEGLCGICSFIALHAVSFHGPRCETHFTRDNGRTFSSAWHRWLCLCRSSQNSSNPRVSKRLGLIPPCTHCWPHSIKHSVTDQFRTRNTKRRNTCSVMFALSPVHREVGHDFRCLFAICLNVHANQVLFQLPALISPVSPESSSVLHVLPFVKPVVPTAIHRTRQSLTSLCQRGCTRRGLTKCGGCVVSSSSRSLESTSGRSRVLPFCGGDKSFWETQAPSSQSIHRVDIIPPRGGQELDILAVPVQQFHRRRPCCSNSTLVVGWIQLFVFTPANFGQGCQDKTTIYGRRLSDQCISSFTRGLFQFAKLAFVYVQTASSHVHPPDQSPCWSSWYVSTYRHVGNKSVYDS